MQAKCVTLLLQTYYYLLKSLKMKATGFSYSVESDPHFTSNSVLFLCPPVTSDALLQKLAGIHQPPSLSTGYFLFLDYSSLEINIASCLSESWSIFKLLNENKNIN